MSAFSKKYSDEQVEAVVSAVLDGVPDQPGSGPQGKSTPEMGRQMTAREAQKAAAEGRLPGLPAFKINLSTVRNYAQDARRDRDGKKPNRLDRKKPADAADEVFKRVLRMTDATLRRAEVTAKSSKGLSLDDLTKLAKFSEQLDRAAKQRMTAPSIKASSTTKDQGQDAGSAEPDQPDDFAAQLAAQAREPRGKASQPPQGPERPPAPGPSTPRAAKNDEEQSDDRVRVGAESSSPDPGRLAAAQALLGNVG